MFFQCICAKNFVFVVIHFLFKFQKYAASGTSGPKTKNYITRVRVPVRKLKVQFTIPTAQNTAKLIACGDAKFIATLLF